MKNRTVSKHASIFDRVNTYNNKLLPSEKKKLDACKNYRTFLSSFLTCFSVKLGYKLPNLSYILRI